MTGWMVRAGRGGYMAQTCRDRGCIAYGWAIPDATRAKTREEIDKLIRTVYPDQSDRTIAVWVGQYHKFVNEMAPGDSIITYAGDRRTYFVGKIIGACQFDPKRVGELEHVRDVEWQFEVERDRLPGSVKNRLTSQTSVFKISPEVLVAILATAKGNASHTSHQSATEAAIGTEVEPLSADESVEDMRHELEVKARELIKDRIVRLDPYEMQDLVAGVLRAMGLKTRVSPRGPDRGCDVLASPDGLGLSQPRVFVEVKHRPKLQTDAQMVRSFLGGRRAGDNGMYVSTGGYSKDARYEAERSNIPIALIDLEDLVGLLVQHYGHMDAEARAIVPLVPVYWPT